MVSDPSHSGDDSARRPPRSSRDGALFEEVYAELHRLAARLFARQAPGHTLQATALVNEAFLKLARRDDPGWTSREHFFAIAATAMRQVLINHARAHRAQKRGAALKRVTLGPDDAVAPAMAAEQLLELDEALTDLARLAPRRARVVEARFFAGMTTQQIAGVLGVAASTVDSDWRFARAWLSRRLSPDAGP